MLNPLPRCANLSQGGDCRRPAAYIRNHDRPSVSSAMTIDFSEKHRHQGGHELRTGDERLTAVLAGVVRHYTAIAKSRNQMKNAGPVPYRGAGRQRRSTSESLLSDVLGASMLVDAVNNRKTPGATESTVLGPFHVGDSPTRELGADIALTGDAPRCVVRGTVRSVDGRPLPGAVMDVWQADDAGFYDTQQPDRVPEGNLRGLFTRAQPASSGSAPSCPAVTQSPTTVSGPTPRATHATPTDPPTSISSPAQKVSPRWSPTWPSRATSRRRRVRREEKPDPRGPTSGRSGAGPPLWGGQPIRPD